jgi:3,4-dihydroxy 2-butanone 4-phosphate synthase/GTP cyclohydrolase II
VLVRTGQTEGSVDLARLAGLRPAGVICEIMKDDGTMARMPDLEEFGREHGMRILSIADLIHYRLQTETLVRRVSERTVVLDQTGTEWRAVVYESVVDKRQALALLKGSIDAEPLLCRVHTGSSVADLFVSTSSDGGATLRDAIRRIEREGRGALLYLESQRTLSEELEHAAGHLRGVAPPPTDSSSSSSDRVRATLRKFGLGAQMLADLGARKLRLLTSSQRKIAGLTGYGIEIVEHVPLPPQEEG